MSAFESLRRHSAEGPDRITQEAARWLDKRAGGPLSEEDAAAFEAWRSHPDHAAAFARLERTLQNVRGVRDDVRLTRRRAAAAARASARSRRPWLPASAAAAVLILVSAVTGMIGLGGDTAAPPAQTATVADARTGLDDRSAVETAIGERLTVTLDDGTQVTLNTRTRLAMRYTEAERVVELQGGQALFDVAHDADRPFIVEAGAQRVRALGTAFDVRRAATGVEVTLLEGRVVVEEFTEPTSDAPERALVHVAELVPGEQFISDLVQAQPQIRTADIERVTSWRRGRMTFRNTTLGEAVAEANRYAHTPIALTDDRMAQLRISGAFPTDQVDAFVEALTTYFPLEEARDDAPETRKARRLVWREGEGG